ncbi:hypothetical protein Pfo_025531, partial [Paulownia fortunei]
MNSQLQVTVNSPLLDDSRFSSAAITMIQRKPVANREHKFCLLCVRNLMADSVILRRKTSVEELQWMTMGQICHLAELDLAESFLCLGNIASLLLHHLEIESAAVEVVSICLGCL